MVQIPEPIHRIDTGQKRFSDTTKPFLSDAYSNIAAKADASLNRAKTSYADSPIYQRGLEAWNPTGIGSVFATGAVPAGDWLSNIFGGDQVTSGKAGGIGGPTAAGFASNVINPILSGTATPDEKLNFANTFGHEMSHLGWQYKPKDERISVGGKTEGGGLSALMGSISGDYAGDEQWNYMHDLMYAPRGYTQEKEIAEKKILKDAYAKGDINKTQYQAGQKKIYDKMIGLNRGIGELPGESYLKEKGLISKGDLSYTPKAHDVIGWSGLTSADKKAIGFGVNPFEDTRAAGQWYKQQKYKKMSQAKKQAALQQRIRQHEAAEAAKQKTTPAYTGPVARDFDPKQDTGRRPDKPGGFTDPGKGSYGPWMANGGIVDLYRYGGF